MRSVRCRNHAVSVGVLVGEMKDSGGQGGLWRDLRDSKSSLQPLIDTPDTEIAF